MNTQIDIGAYESFEKIFLLSNPEIESHVLRLRPRNYDSFISQLYKDLDEVVARIAASRQYYYTLDEDQLSVSIIGQLQAMCYQAHHDVANGGHVDIYVSKNNFKWLGEAKIFSDNGYIMDGFYQLTTRYSAGDHNATCGGMLIFINNEKSTDSVMTGWKDFLGQQHKLDAGLVELTTAACPLHPQCFLSTHKHAVSGLDYRVRHIPMNISFKPMDGANRPRNKRGRAPKKVAPTPVK